MHRAASTGNSELCELLIEEGAEIDAVDNAGQTPLMNAVICENKEVHLPEFCEKIFTKFMLLLFVNFFVLEPCLFFMSIPFCFYELC